MQAHRRFKISKDPLLHFIGVGAMNDIGPQTGLTGLRTQPFLFAIARDTHTIFASWNIDWRAVFENVMPADRQVHLRVIGGDGVIEMTVAVEPMSPMHYLTISGLHNTYRLEMGYFQPLDTWNSVVRSDEIETPPQASAELSDVDVATIPFHLSFQQLANLFKEGNDAPLATTVSKFQKRITSSDSPNEITPFDRQILRKLNLSLSETAAAELDFKKIDTEKLMRRARAMVSIRRDESGTWIRSESSWS